MTDTLKGAIKVLTLDTLIAKGACAEALKQFAKIFPNGAPVAVETFVNVASEFNWECAARLLLTPRNRVKFENTRSAACVTYYAAHDVAVAAYDAATAPAYVTLNAVRDAYNAYNASRDARDADYTTSRATVFATLYIDQESQTP